MVDQIVRTDNITGLDTRFDTTFSAESSRALRWGDWNVSWRMQQTGGDRKRHKQRDAPRLRDKRGRAVACGQEGAEAREDTDGELDFDQCGCGRDRRDGSQRVGLGELDRLFDLRRELLRGRGLHLGCCSGRCLA